MTRQIMDRTTHTARIRVCEAPDSLSSQGRHQFLLGDCTQRPHKDNNGVTIQAASVAVHFLDGCQTCADVFQPWVIAGASGAETTHVSNTAL